MITSDIFSENEVLDRKDSAACTIVSGGGGGWGSVVPRYHSGYRHHVGYG